MTELVYPRERILGLITLVLGVLAWGALILGTFGGALIILAIGFVLYLFLQSALISHIKGNGVELSETQFPDLYAQFNACCDQLQIKHRPQAYILNGNGGLNAFATKFLGTQYVVLLSDVVDAMSSHTDGVRFYIGHELGHLRMGHLNGHLLRWPMLWLPLIGAAYSRARESTCDRHGLACSSSAEGAAQALAALSAGPECWKQLNIAALRDQAKYSSGFWMSFHELTAAYPWLTKRVARVLDSRAEMPRRNGFAYLLAMFIPYAGRLGGAFGVLMLVYVIGVLAAIAIPAYQDYTIRAQVAMTVTESQSARDTLGEYYVSTQKIPESLDEAGVPSLLSGGTELILDPESMVLTVVLEHGDLIFEPGVDADGSINWSCSSSEDSKISKLNTACNELGN